MSTTEIKAQVTVSECPKVNFTLNETDYYGKRLDAWLEIDESGLVYVYTYPADQTPESNWHERDARWEICSHLSSSSANKLMADCLDDLKRVHAGREIVWDGRNWVGQYDADAVDAQAAIAELCLQTYDRNSYDHDRRDVSELAEGDYEHIDGYVLIDGVRKIRLTQNADVATGDEWSAPGIGMDADGDEVECRVYWATVDFTTEDGGEACDWDAPTRIDCDCDEDDLQELQTP